MLARVVAILLALLALGGAVPQASALEAGFGEADITPKVDDPKRPVWLAGYGPGRQATGVHDPIMVRAVVLRDGDDRVAIACADLVGLQYPTVEAIRAALPGYRYVLVSSTHNHEAPDVVGIWGRTFAHRGVDDGYLKHVVDQTVAAIRAAEKSLAPVKAFYGTAEDESLLGDSRKPDVRDGVLRVLRFDHDDKPAGLLVQWNCHPEALGSKNKLLTSDFVGPAVAALGKKYACPVVYVTGAVGGLMAPPDGRVFDADGKELKEGDFEYARVYGELTASLAAQAVDKAQPIELTPLRATSLKIAVPVSNPYYRTAHALGVLKREARVWTGDMTRPGELLTHRNAEATMAVETEVAVLRLGELAVAAIPGEIYPELVYGRYPDKPEPGVDYPDAPLEPSVVSLLKADKWMLIGLANDEIGYIIPKRQWDQASPFAYGRTKSQYGEINSCGSDIAPLVMEALSRCAK